MDLLAGLEEEDVRRLLARATRRRFSRREVLFHEGDPADTVHLIQKGRVAVRITTELGTVATLDVVGQGQAIGEMALLSPASRRGATAIALEAVETMVLSAASFNELRSEHPSVDAVLMETMGTRIRNLNARLCEALYVPVEARVARRLLGVADSYATGPEGTVVVPLTQDDLAGLVGTTRESVNRILRRFQSEGVLELRRGSISLLDTTALTRLSR